MKQVKTLLLVATGSFAEEQGYGSKSNYGPPAPKQYNAYAQPINAYGNQYSNSPYPQEKYHPYGHTEDYIAPVVPELKEPYPFMQFEPDTEDNLLSLPHLGDYHCFLTGAPWTSCGRKSLTSYFLDQCMVFHQMMSKNVDGICGGKPPKPQPRAARYNDQYYGKDYAPAEEPEPKAALSEEFMKEKCFQNAFVSITTATVMCLTENMIRIQYIEHYAKDASRNPIEGPTLYLKKLHAFIDEVVGCPGNNAKNYPNLWQTFKPSERVQYNPNAPYYENANGKFQMNQYSSGEASGLKAYSVGDQFLCADIKSLKKTSDGKLVYTSLSTDHHYDPKILDTCNAAHALNSNVAPSSSALKSLVPGGKSSYECRAVTGAKQAGAFDTIRNSGEQYTVDMSLENLYDAVHYVEAETSVLRRPQTIAELAVSNAGIREQPILEGFGIMYFCGFYACKANNGGDLDGTCFPEFDEELDWQSVDEVRSKSLKKDSAKIEFCLKENKFLTAHDVAEDASVKAFREALRRSYTCMAEKSVVDFFTKIYPEKERDVAASLVYGRHLANEKCYEAANGLCTGDEDLYVLMEAAMDSIIATCEKNKLDHSTKKKTYGAYGQQQRGYQQAPKYGNSYSQQGRS